MNLIKITKSGLVIDTVAGISGELAEKFSNCKGYHFKQLKNEIPFIENWYVEDNTIEENENFPKMIRATSQTILSVNSTTEINIDKINMLSNIQGSVVEAVLKRESASFVIERFAHLIKEILEEDEQKVTDKPYDEI